MPILILIFFISSCSNNKLLKPQDTMFNEEDRNWEEVYSQELKSALENDDEEAFHFFWRYYLEEKYKTNKK